MPKTKANGIELCYETFGSSDDPAMLLIMGLGAQMIAWPDEFCELLASAGFHVIRYDNRDVGESTWFDDAGSPDVGAAFSGNATPAYTLEDMADDAGGLLEALGIGTAHIVGVSMGGMIAQLVAAQHSSRTLSLCSIMSTPGGQDSTPPTEAAMQALMAPRPTTREQAIETALNARKVIGSTGFPADEDKLREQAARAYDRANHPEGMMRQMVAIMSSPSRVELLGNVAVPTVVIHGTVDPLVPPDNGDKTAKAIPGADLVTVDGMGHDLPEGAWPQIVDAIVANTAKVSA